MAASESGRPERDARAMGSDAVSPGASGAGAAGAGASGLGAAGADAVGAAVSGPADAQTARGQTRPRDETGPGAQAEASRPAMEAVPQTADADADDAPALAAGAAEAPTATGGAPAAQDPGAAPAAPRLAARADISTLLRRPDFLAAAAARRWSAPGLVVQARERRAGDKGAGARVGYTCSKKVGNAVARNRAKRRLRAAAAEALPGRARIGWDYVLIGRHEATAARPFPALVQDLVEALEKLHAGKGSAGGPPRKRGHGRGKGKQPKPGPAAKGEAR